VAELDALVHDRFDRAVLEFLAHFSKRSTCVCVSAALCAMLSSILCCVLTDVVLWCGVVGPVFSDLLSDLQRSEVVREFPFDGWRKRSSVLRRLPPPPPPTPSAARAGGSAPSQQHRDRQSYVLSVRGSRDVLELCSQALVKGVAVPMDQVNPHTQETPRYVHSKAKAHRLTHLLISSFVVCCCVLLLCCAEVILC
jgi:magnesium-transporting ATPase (P-type)